MEASYKITWHGISDEHVLHMNKRIVKGIESF